MEVVILAAIEEATGIQSESWSESASENVGQGIQGSHRIHYCLREAETGESQLQLIELDLELVFNSVEIIEQLLKCLLLQAPVCEETTKKTIRKRRKKQIQEVEGAPCTTAAHLVQRQEPKQRHN
jgi:hypothetical protein